MRRFYLLFLLLPAAIAAQPVSAQTVWSSEQAANLLSIIEQIGSEGLDPADYEPEALRADLAGKSPNGWDARATSTFLRLAGDVSGGHMREHRALRWYIAGPQLGEAGGKAVMASALSANDLRGALDRLAPQHRQYSLLKAALAATPPRDKAGIERIRANLERWRWMPRDLGNRYLLVNVPAFTVSLVENGRVVERRRVVVGKPATPTPQFAASVTGVILNPWWEIPPSIVAESVGRLVRNHPAQARARGYVVSGAKYRQAPGPGNALGQIKLVMPNPFNVYLHDTPSKALFDEDSRAFSHGCIRVQDPLGLAETLLRGTAGWSRTDIDRTLAGGRTIQTNLAHPLPVYVAYFTAAAEEGGEIATFPDIYGRDGPIVAAMVDRHIDTGP